MAASFTHISGKYDLKLADEWQEVQPKRPNQRLFQRISVDLPGRRMRMELPWSLREGWAQCHRFPAKWRESPWKVSKVTETSSLTPGCCNMHNSPWQGLTRGRQWDRSTKIYVLSVLKQITVFSAKNPWHISQHPTMAYMCNLMKTEYNKSATCPAHTAYVRVSSFDNSQSSGSFQG